MDKHYIYKPEYSNSWALVIGINKYLSCPPLDYAVNDAQAIAEVLKERFDFPQDNIILLLDEEATLYSIFNGTIKTAGYCELITVLPLFW